MDLLNKLLQTPPKPYPPRTTCDRCNTNGVKTLPINCMNHLYCVNCFIKLDECPKCMHQFDKTSRIKINHC